MKLKTLESILQTLDAFERPNIELEQYTTSPHITANFLNVVGNENLEIKGKFIADLGCGCGNLAIGASLFGAGACIGFEVDSSALDIALRNKDEVECDNVDFVQCDVMDLEDSKWRKVFDTVIMNPPFGTKNNKGIDMKFLRTALSLARTSVYSFHKIETLEHIKRVASSWNVDVTPCYEVKFNIPHSYKRHRLVSKDVSVALLRFSFAKQRNVL
ncbi:rRNA N(6)-adenosine-methyltransferase METTL5 isoform X2 [Parasteatoda tepidariorum]|uniref:rRNA N(6)-adenosine-methyltransferase METTL5 isoform X2 n=1 Tax=Parasteatoda tepidariorum TaxID=114398 RepID=UPI00077FCFD6|nr:rRNA N6-adenosine-methyltransferase METTL5 [Parasteatoda tepidariorum]